VQVLISIYVSQFQRISGCVASTHQKTTVLCK